MRFPGGLENTPFKLRYPRNSPHLDTKLGETPNVDAQNKNAASERT